MNRAQRALYDAIRKNNVDEVNSILEKHPNYVNSVLTESGIGWWDSAGYTALHWAAYDGHIDVINILIKHRANPLIKNKGDCTPKQTADYWYRNYPNKFKEIASALQPGTDASSQLPPSQRAAASFFGGWLGGIVSGVVYKTKPCVEAVAEVERVTSVARTLST